MAILELILLLLLLLFGGVRQDVSQQPIVVEEAVSESSVQDLIDYGSQFFPEDEGWRVFLTEGEGDYSPSVAWTDTGSQVVIHIFEYTIPLVEPVTSVMETHWVEGSFSDGYLDVVSKLDCEADGVYLYHLSLEFADEPYVARVWQYYVDDRVIGSVRLVFPARRQAELESYAQILFPDFYTCDN